MTFKQKIALVIGVVIFGIAEVAYASLRPEDPQRKKDNLFALARECTNSSNVTLCARSVMRELLKLMPATEILDNISTKYDPVMCHYLGHALGKELYVRDKSPEIALGNCSQVCESACIHGVVGETFRTELGGSGDDLDVQHLSLNDIRKVGGRLCKDSATCHAVGHALFQAYGEFKPTLDVCDEVSRGSIRVMCYRGVFMEYFDNFTTNGNLGESAISPPDARHPEKTCDQETVERRRECLRMFGWVAIKRLMENEGFSRDDAGDSLYASCKKYANPLDVRACIAGIGFRYAPVILSDSSLVRTQCERLEEKSAQKACILGLMSKATPFFGISKVYTLCSGFTSTENQTSCFRSMFYTAKDQWIPTEPIDELCRANASCVSARRFTDNPWDTASL